MFQPQAVSIFFLILKTHNNTPSLEHSVLKLEKCLKPLVKVYRIIYSKLTIDRAEDTQPHTCTQIHKEQ